VPTDNDHPNLKAVGAYVYAGGFSVGVRHAGFDVLCHLEGDNGYGASSAQLNWPEMPIHVGPKNWPLKDLKGQVDFLFANPPCALFSAMGIRSTRGADAWRTDPRLEHWTDSFDAFEEVRPRAFALESVTQAYTAGRELIDELTKRSLMGGYSVTHLLLDAKWHGIPQTRRRFFFVAHRQPKLVGYQPNWQPPPTVGETLGEVLEPGWSWQEYLQERRPDLIALLRDTPPGGLLCDTFDRSMTHEEREARRTPKGIRGRPAFRHGRLHLDKIMGAYVGGDGYHPTEDRVIGINESKALCGYPLDFQLAPPEKEWPSLLARAVMPPVGAWLARAVAATLSGEEVDQPSARRVTLVDVREPGRQPEDLTHLYLNDTGRVRLRVKADGTLNYAVNTATPKPVTTRPSPAVVTSEVVETATPIAPPPPTVEVVPPATSTVTPVTPSLITGDFDPADPRYAHHQGEGSGKLIQRLWCETSLTPEQLVAVVHANWSGRTTKVGDIYYNYNKLVQAGVEVRPWRVKNATKATKPSVPVRSEPTTSSAPRVTSRPLVRDKQDREGRGNVADSRPRFLVTGCTPIQVGSERTELKIITSTRAMVAALTELGFNVEWRGITPGEDLEGYAGCLVYLQKFNSIACSYYPGAMWTVLKRPDAILGMDDWQTHTIKAGFDTFARSRERAFRLHGEDLEESVKDVLFEGLQRYAALERWPHPTIVPTFEGGDTSLLRVPAELVPIDPTAFTPRYPHEPAERERAWVQASLLLKDPPSTTWPVTYFGNLGTGKGGAGRSAVREPQPRVPEPELMKVYAKHWGILSPPHDHPGSGWWRVRYLMAADAGCVLSAHPDEARILGEPYVWASNLKYVEAASDYELELAAAQQAACLADHALPRDVVLERLREVLSAQGVRLPTTSRSLAA
jgi:DNA (cytosine-5)-methyltransferase 1